MSGPEYKAFTLNHLDRISPLAGLPPEILREMKVVGQVLPFKTNNYVIDQLIRWDDAPDDPLFTLTFPRRAMLGDEDFDRMAALVDAGADRKAINAEANRIRRALNPHPAGQLEYNVPTLEGRRLEGLQHKYRQTVLFFPSQGQTCHAYCTFCFRWPQFVGLDGMKFATREAEDLINYLRTHPEVTDLLFTGGDPLVMKTGALRFYLDALMEADLPNLQTIRIGTKALGFWPYRFLTDPDADDLMRLFERVTASGRHLAFMAHVNHPRELSTDAAQKAIARILATGAQIRTQSPLLQHINDDPKVWSEMWREQTRMGVIPYYMFMARDTGAQNYFGVPIFKAWEIFQEAYQHVSGVARTVRGPSMSAAEGKVQVLGASEIQGEKVLVLQFLQGRNPDWVKRPFFARLDEEALWLDELTPAFGEKRFFFEEEWRGEAVPGTLAPPGRDWLSFLRRMA